MSQLHKVVDSVVDPSRTAATTIAEVAVDTAAAAEEEDTATAEVEEDTAAIAEVEIGSEVAEEEIASEVAVEEIASAVAVAEEMAVDSLRALAVHFLRVLHLNKELQKVQFQTNLLSPRTSEISHTTSRMPSSKTFSQLPKE